MLLKTLGRRNVILIGQFLLVVQFSMLGSLDYIKDADTFFLLSIAAQMLGGLGGGANNCATMAIVSSMDLEDREKNIGFMEMAFGVGMLLGPMVGGVLYHFGDYKLPFFFFGKYNIISYFSAVLSLLPIPYIQSVLANSEIEKYESSKAQSPEMRHLISKPRFLFGLLSQMTLTMSLQYMAPNLSIHMQFYGYNAAQIGLSFGIPGLIYAACSPFIYLITAKFKKRGVILVGFLMVTMATLMIGGSDLF